MIFGICRQRKTCHAEGRSASGGKLSSKRKIPLRGFFLRVGTYPRTSPALRDGTGLRSTASRNHGKKTVELHARLRRMRRLRSYALHAFAATGDALLKWLSTFFRNTTTLTVFRLAMDLNTARDTFPTIAFALAAGMCASFAAPIIDRFSFSGRNGSAFPLRLITCFGMGLFIGVFGLW